MEKYKNQYRSINEMPLMGFEIVNNTPEAQSLKFFGPAHRHYMHKTNLSIRTIFDDNVYDDRDLSLITGFIFDYRHLRIFATIFNTSLLYGSFSGKKFSIQQRREMGQMQSISFDVSKYVKDGDPNMAEIDVSFVVGFFTELEQTSIEAGERLLILFDLGNRKFHGMNDMIEMANKLLGSEKKKILLTL